MKFRKKPVVIEAFQWFPHMGEVGGVVYWPLGEIGRKPVIRTIEACQDVTAGDWIITGVQGERYPCKPDIFAATYQAADEPVAAPSDTGREQPDEYEDVPPLSNLEREELNELRQMKMPELFPGVAPAQAQRERELALLRHELESIRGKKPMIDIETVEAGLSQIGVTCKLEAIRDGVKWTARLRASDPQKGQPEDKNV